MQEPQNNMADLCCGWDNSSMYYIYIVSWNNFGSQILYYIIDNDKDIQACPDE